MSMNESPKLPTVRGRHFLCAFLGLCAYFALVLLAVWLGAGKRHIRVVVHGILLTAMGLSLIVWPMHCAHGIGYLYWHMSKYTVLGKTEESKKYFFAERPLWFRALGVVILVVAVLHVVEGFGDECAQ